MHESMTAKAIVLHAEKAPIAGIAHPGPHQTYKHPRLAIEERALGELAPDAVRVSMAYAGLCGTDVHLVDTNPETGYVRTTAPAVIPPEGRIIGHEGVGRVVQVGAAVKNLRPGAYVTFESIMICHYCDICRRGQFNQCRNAKLVGLEADGLFGTVVDLPAMLAHDVSDMVRGEQDLEAMACVEPAGVAYLACWRAHVQARDTVVIFGGGPIGIFAAMLCRTVLGASAVFIVEPIDLRRALAEKWSDQTYDVETFFQDGPPLVDVVIEASGDMSNVRRVAHRMDADGRVVLLARSGAPLNVDAVDRLITNGVSIFGSRGHLGGPVVSILDLYRNGRLPLDEAVTGVVEGLEGLRGLLGSPEQIARSHCKVLARFDGT